MKLEEQIDKALSEMPMWEPPFYFARRVVAIAQADSCLRTRPERLFWFDAALQGAAVSIGAMAGGSVISSGATSFALVFGRMLEGYVHSVSLFYR
jgi:hypothetical protein